MKKQLFDFVFCCLSAEQKQQVTDALRNNIPAPIYYAQANLVKEKHGYRCSKCGKEYPFLQLECENAQLDPRAYAKPTGFLQKGKKSADVFCGSFYYAKNKKALQKYEMNLDGAFVQTDSIPVMNDVYHTILSQDGRYIATETFGGTIAVIDTHSKQPVAKKSGRKINGSFIFTDDNKLLYFFEEAVRCWNFLEKEDRILWRVPEQWKRSDNPKKTIRIVCGNVIYNRIERACIFALGAGDTTYVVFFCDLELTKVVPLPRYSSVSKLVFSQGTNQYTRSEDGNVIIYDAYLRIVEKFAAPVFHIIHDGGGAFPVTRHKTTQPDRTFLSPDGKWLLLDYFNYVILMRHEDKEIRFCLFSYVGKVAQHMGFVDCTHFWYTWGDTTYIQQIN